MFLVGISLGSDTRSLQGSQKHESKNPADTLSNNYWYCYWGLVHINFRYTILIKEPMAVGAGYGYYSLSSIIIRNSHSDALGVVALLSNVIREIITLLLAPLMAIYFGKVAPICSGGATSMDTTLPIISRASGKSMPFHRLFMELYLPYWCLSL